MKKQLSNGLLFFPPCKVHVIDSDGNCQWKALSWACFGTDEYHMKIRNRVCSEIETNWDHYGKFITEKMNYVELMRLNGTWGDHCTLAAFCNVYDQYLLVINGEGNPLVVTPIKKRNDVKASEWLVIIYDPQNMHYNSIAPYYSSPTSKLLRRIQSKDTGA